MNVKLSEDVLKRLEPFKSVVEEVIGKKLEFDVYVALVLGEGMNSMLQDIINPQERNVLWQTVLAMFKENPDFISGFVASILKRGGEEIETRKKELAERFKHYV